MQRNQQERQKEQDGDLVEGVAALTVVSWGGQEGFMAADEAGNVFADLF